MFVPFLLCRSLVHATDFPQAERDVSECREMGKEVEIRTRIPTCFRSSFTSVSASEHSRRRGRFAAVISVRRIRLRGNGLAAPALTDETDYFSAHLEADAGDTALHRRTCTRVSSSSES